MRDIHMDNMSRLYYRNPYGEDYCNLGETYLLFERSMQSNNRDNLCRLISEVGSNVWQYNSKHAVAVSENSVIISYKLSIKNISIKITDHWRLSMLNLIHSYHGDYTSTGLSAEDSLKIKMYSLLQHSLHIVMFKYQDILRHQFGQDYKHHQTYPANETHQDHQAKQSNHDHQSDQAKQSKHDYHAKQTNQEYQDNKKRILNSADIAQLHDQNNKYYKPCQHPAVFNLQSHFLFELHSKQENKIVSRCILKTKSHRDARCYLGSFLGGEAKLLHGAKWG